MSGLILYTSEDGAGRIQLRAAVAADEAVLAAPEARMQGCKQP